jgi:hypothetical protein
LKWLTCASRAPQEGSAQARRPRCATRAAAALALAAVTSAHAANAALLRSASRRCSSTPLRCTRAHASRTAAMRGVRGGGVCRPRTQQIKKRRIVTLELQSFSSSSLCCAAAPLQGCWAHVGAGCAARWRATCWPRRARARERRAMRRRRRPVRPAAAATAALTLALALALARGAAGDDNSSWTAFEPDEKAYAASSSVRAARAAWDAACVQPDNADGCGMAALLGETEEHYRTLDRVLVLGACARCAAARRLVSQ